MSDDDITLQFLLSPAARGFYGNGEPKWVEGKRSPRPSSTRRDARLQCEELVQRLCTEHGDDLRDEIAADLSECTVHTPCGSGACPLCVRTIQRWFVETASEHPHLAEGGLSVVSIVPKFGCFPATNAPTNTIWSFNKDIGALLTEAGIHEAIGGVDPNFNEHRDGAFEPHGQLQAWLIIRSELLTKSVKDRLRSLLEVSSLHRRPLRIESFDRGLNGYAYALKHTYDRRVSIPPVIDKQGETIERRNTRHRNLRRKQEVALALLLHQAGLRARLILHGWKLIPSGDADPSSNKEGK
jgi:hypothetical protein